MGSTSLTPIGSSRFDAGAVATGAHTQPVEHSKSGGLKNEARPQRFRRFELIEKTDAMTLGIQGKRRGETRGACATDGNIEG